MVTLSTSWDRPRAQFVVSSLSQTMAQHSSIQRLNVPPAILEALYPWVKTPWIAFRVVFDVPPQSSPLLVVSGAPGRTRLDF